MVGGKALRGLGKALLKKTKPKYLKKISRGTPTKAAFIARRNALRGIRGAPTAEKYKKLLGPTPKAVKAPKKKPIIGKFEVGVGTGVGGTLLYQNIKKGKDAEAKKADKDLKKAIEKHKKLDRERKKKQADKKTNKKYYKGK